MSNFNATKLYPTINIIDVAICMQQRYMELPKLHGATLLFVKICMQHSNIHDETKLHAALLHVYGGLNTTLQINTV